MYDSGHQTMMPMKKYVHSKGPCAYRLPGYMPVSLSLHHSHPCIIYEVNMRHIQDKYDAVMKQISIFFSKYEVLRTAILNTAKTL